MQVKRSSFLLLSILNTNNMFLLLFAICIFISLFMLYVLVKHDFVLARKSLLLQEIFDTTFFAYIAFIFLGRLLFVLGEQQYSFFHFVKFFHLIRYPGILIIGGVLGFGIVIYYVFRKKKILLRIFDIYSLSMYPIFLFALLVSYFGGYFLYFNALLFLLSCIFFGIGIYSYKNYTLKDGTITYLFICLISIFTIVSEFSGGNRTIFSFFTIPQILSMIIFLGASFLLLVHEGMISGK